MNTKIINCFIKENKWNNFGAFLIAIFNTFSIIVYTHATTFWPIHFSSDFLLIIIVARWHQMARFIFVIMGSVKGLLSNVRHAITGTNAYHM